MGFISAPAGYTVSPLTFPINVNGNTIISYKVCGPVGLGNGAIIVTSNNSNCSLQLGFNITPQPCSCAGWTTTCGINSVLSSTDVTVNLTFNGTSTCESMNVAFTATGNGNGDTYTITSPNPLPITPSQTVILTVHDVSGSIVGKKFFINSFVNGTLCQSCDPGIVPVLTPTPTATPTSTPRLRNNGAEFLALQPNVLQVIPGQSFSVTITAFREAGIMAARFRSTVHFTSTDPSATLPPDYTFTLADGGVHVFTVVLNTVGSWTISANAVLDPDLRGTSPPILVVAPTSTFTPTITPTNTPTITPSPTPTPNSAQATATSAAIQTSTEVGTATAQAIATSTSIAAQTSTALATATSRANSTSTSIAAQTATAAGTATAQSTSTPTSTCNPCILATDQSANLVIGQPNFTSDAQLPWTASSLSAPEGIFQAGGKLVVSDLNNSRVLIYNPIPTSNQPAAVMEIGQPNFTSSGANQVGSVGGNTLFSPRQVWSDGTTLIVADELNHRVLIYDNINNLPATNGSASVVIGQINFTSNQANQGGSASSNTLNTPAGVFYDGQRLFISDNGNNRVLVYNSLPVTNNAPAAVVIGQQNFTSSLANQGLSAPTSQTLSFPQEIWVYNGSLFVTEYGNNRVLIFNNGGHGIDSLNFPLASGSAGVTADAVIGQNNFTSNAAGTSANSLSIPVAVSASNCQLYIADSSNFRVLIYNNIPTGTANPPADNVLGQPDFLSNQEGLIQNNNFYPYAVQAINGEVYVADNLHNRVLQFACQAGTGSTSAPLKVSALSMNPGKGETSSERSPTVTPTVTFTPTVTPTPTIGSLTALAAPNISRNGQPIQFQVSLPKAAKVHLSMYTLLGEEIYQAAFQGNAGLNTLEWDLKNTYANTVASGLYVYVIQAVSGEGSRRITGKIVVVR